MSELLATDPLAAERAIDDVLSWRLFVPDDAEEVFRIIQDDPDITTRITWTAAARSADDIRQRIEKFPERGGYRGALLEFGQVIGYGALYESKTRKNEHEIGYFCAPDKRGRGYTKKLVINLMDTAKRCGTESFALYIADSNLPSQAVATSLGFVATDELRRDDALDCLERRYERAA
jgi:RimJ/RimL family protein N-acetyltransferase